MDAHTTSRCDLPLRPRMTLPTTKHVALPVLLIEDEPSVTEYVRIALGAQRLRGRVQPVWR
jgi:hypothetical protein